jgi:hypothetical protein
VKYRKEVGIKSLLMQLEEKKFQMLWHGKGMVITLKPAVCIIFRELIRVE